MRPGSGSIREDVVGTNTRKMRLVKEERYRGISGGTVPKKGKRGGGAAWKKKMIANEAKRTERR